jgi:hypothetical protein
MGESGCRLLKVRCQRVMLEAPHKFHPRTEGLSDRHGIGFFGGGVPGGAMPAFGGRA